MNRANCLISILSFLAVSGNLCLQSQAQSRGGFRHIPSTQEIEAAKAKAELEEEAAPWVAVDSSMFIVRNADEIIAQLPYNSTPVMMTKRILGPWIFTGYQPRDKRHFRADSLEIIRNLPVIYNDSSAIDLNDKLIASNDSVSMEDGLGFSTPDSVPAFIPEPSEPLVSKDFVRGYSMSGWLHDIILADRLQNDIMYSMMVADADNIENAYWTLPERPKLPEDEVTFAAFLKKLNLPDVDPEKAELPENEIQKIHWLHTVNSGLQFSQAYISDNWYQGGNNHTSLLFNFLWNVQLNPVYHPKFLFQSSLSYKLGLNSTPQDEVHSYSISEDVLQYNLNMGLKAVKKWYYSLNTQFKTQILRNYERNSMNRKASFLSPGDFNVGLGMSYSTQNKKKTFQLTATLSPISYNLRTCITDKIDHEKFDIRPDRKSRSEIGSNGEVNWTWKIAWNIEYRSRLFLFTDYKYFLSDWENTISFNINKFLSTQLYVHMRYDSSSEIMDSWKHFMLREVLSFGLSYTFSTKK